MNLSYPVLRTCKVKQGFYLPLPPSPRWLHLWLYGFMLHASCFYRSCLILICYQPICIDDKVDVHMYSPCTVHTYAMYIRTYLAPKGMEGTYLDQNWRRPGFSRLSSINLQGPAQQNPFASVIQVHYSVKEEFKKTKKLKNKLIYYCNLLQRH